MNLRTRLLVALCVTCPIVAQDPQPTPAAAPAAATAVRVSLTTKVGGKPEPRLDADGKDTGSKRWTQRELRWRIVDAEFTAPAVAHKALARYTRDPAWLRASPDNPGTRLPLPLVCEPDPEVRWCEILREFDAAMTAGFVEWRLVGVDSPWFVPKSVDEPVLDGGATIVPHATFSEPDDEPVPGRTVVHVRQNGDIVLDGKVLFTWRAGQPEDLLALRARLLEIRADMEQRGKVSESNVVRRRGIDLPVLVVADMWCEWRDVRRLLRCLTEPEIGFWRIEVGVADHDYEVRMAKQREERR